MQWVTRACTYNRMCVYLTRVERTHTHTTYRSSSLRLLQRLSSINNIHSGATCLANNTNTYKNAKETKTHVVMVCARARYRIAFFTWSYSVSCERFQQIDRYSHFFFHRFFFVSARHHTLNTHAETHQTNDGKQLALSWSEHRHEKIPFELTTKFQMCLILLKWTQNKWIWFRFRCLKWKKSVK